ncbi:MAG: DUF2141 domain-containing protein [Candidatus Kapabacteria bacterium]|nr:DUF2141 domain-containing protein [Candidatus Kapabacteria bacterium]
MKYIYRNLFVFLIILFFVNNAIAENEKGNIKIEVLGFENNNGMARILIFSENEKKAFPNKKDQALMKFIVPIVNNKVDFEFKDLPYGNYAITVHHDENNNSKLDFNWIHIPNEGLGCTNDAKGFFGPPSFDKAKVVLNQKLLNLKINMVN